MAKVCSNCGAQIQDGVKFCGKCGQKIQVKQTTAPQQRQDTAPQQRQDTEPQQRQDSAPPQRQDSAPPQQRQDTEPQQRQDSAPQQRQDTAPPQRQDTEPPQQNQISADEAKENIKNFFSGGFQSAVEKFSALSLKNKAICVAVIVIALSMLFGGNSKTNSPKVQGKYLGMDVQTFVEDYNASLNSEWIKKLSGDASVNRDALKIIGIEQAGNGQINFKLNGAPIQVFNCQTADGYLAAIQLWTSSSDNPAAFVSQSIMFFWSCKTTENSTSKELTGNYITTSATDSKSKTAVSISVILIAVPAMLFFLGMKTTKGEFGR